VSNLIEMAVMMLIVIVCIFCLLTLILHLYYKFRHDWDKLATTTVENCRLNQNNNKKNRIIADLLLEIKEIERDYDTQILTKELWSEIKEEVENS
jgi:hypothetical protein